MPVLGKSHWVINPKYYQYLPIKVIEEMAFQRDNNILAETIVNIGHMFNNLGLVHIGCEKKPPYINEVRREATLMWEFVKKNYPKLIKEAEEEGIEAPEPEKREGLGEPRLESGEYQFGPGLPESPEEQPVYREEETGLIPPGDLSEFPSETIRNLCLGSPDEFLAALEEVIDLGIQLAYSRSQEEGATTEPDVEETEENTLLQRREQAYNHLREMYPQIKLFLTNQSEYTPPIKFMISAIKKDIYKVIEGDHRIIASKLENYATRKDISGTGKWIETGRWRTRQANPGRDAEMGNGIFNISGKLVKLNPEDFTQRNTLNEISRFIISQLDNIAPAAEQAAILPPVPINKLHAYVADIRKAISNPKVQQAMAAVPTQNTVDEEGNIRHPVSWTESIIPDLLNGNFEDVIQIAASRVPPPGSDTTVFDIIKNSISPETRDFLHSQYNRNALKSIKDMYSRVRDLAIQEVRDTKEYDEAGDAVETIQQQAADELRDRLKYKTTVDLDEIDHEAGITEWICYQIRLPGRPIQKFYDPAPDEEINVPQEQKKWISKVRNDLNGSKKMFSQEKQQLGDQYEVIKRKIYQADFEHAKEKIIHDLRFHKSKEGKREVVTPIKANAADFIWVGDGDHIADIPADFLGKNVTIQINRRNDITARRTTGHDNEARRAAAILKIIRNDMSEEARGTIFQHVLGGRATKIEFPPGSEEIKNISFSPKAIRTISNEYVDENGDPIMFKGYLVRYKNHEGKPEERMVYTGPCTTKPNPEDSAWTYARKNFNVDVSEEIEVFETEKTKTPIEVLSEILGIKKQFNPLSIVRGSGTSKYGGRPGDFLWGIYLGDEDGHFDREVPIGLKRNEEGEIVDDPSVSFKLFAFHTLRDAELAASIYGPRFKFKPTTREPDGEDYIDQGYGLKMVSYNTRDGRKLVIANYENPRSLSSLDRITDLMPSSRVVSPNDYKKKIDPTDPYSAMAWEDDDGYNRWLDQKLGPTGWTKEEILETLEPVIRSIADNIYYKHRLFAKQQEIEDVRSEARKLVFKALENDTKRNNWYDPVADRDLVEIDDDPADSTKPNKEQLRAYVRQHVAPITAKEAQEAVASAQWTPVENVWRYKHRGRDKYSYFHGVGEDQPPTEADIIKALRYDKHLSDDDLQRITAEVKNEILPNLEPVKETMYYTTDIRENGRPTWWNTKDAGKIAAKIVDDSNYTTQHIEDTINRMRNGPEGERLEKRNPGFLRYVLRTISMNLTHKYLAGPNRRITAHPAGGVWDNLIVSTPIQSYVLTVYQFVHPVSGERFSTDGVTTSKLQPITKQETLNKVVTAVLDEAHIPNGINYVMPVKTYTYANDFERSEGRSQAQEFTDKMRYVNVGIRQILDIYAYFLQEKVEEGPGQRLTYSASSGTPLIVGSGEGQRATDFNLQNYLDKFIYVKCVPIPKMFSLDMEMEDDERDTLISGQRATGVPTPDTIAQQREMVNALLKLPVGTKRGRDLLRLAFSLDDPQAQLGMFRDFVQMQKNKRLEWVDEKSGLQIPAKKYRWIDKETGLSMDLSGRYDPTSDEFKERIFKPDFERMLVDAKTVYEAVVSKKIEIPQIETLLAKSWDEEDIRIIMVLVDMLEKGKDPNALYDEMLDRMENQGVAPPSLSQVMNALKERKVSNYWEDAKTNFSMGFPEGWDPKDPQKKYETITMIVDKLEPTVGTEMELYATQQALAEIRKEHRKSGAAIDQDQIKVALRGLAADIYTRLSRKDDEEYKKSIESEAKDILKRGGDGKFIRLKLHEIEINTEPRQIGSVMDQEAVDRTKMTMRSLRNKIRMATDDEKKDYYEKEYARQQDKLDKLQAGKHYYHPDTNKYYPSRDVGTIISMLKSDSKYLNYFSKKYNVSFPEKENEEAILQSLRAQSKSVRKFSDLLPAPDSEEREQKLKQIAHELSEANIGEGADDVVARFRHVGSLEGVLAKGTPVETLFSQQELDNRLEDEARYISNKLTSAHFSVQQVGRLSEKDAESLIDKLGDNDINIVQSALSSILSYGPDKVLVDNLLNMVEGGGKWRNDVADQINSIYEKFPNTTPSERAYKRVLSKYIGPSRKYWGQKFAQPDETLEQEVVAKPQPSAQAVYGMKERGSRPGEAWVPGPETAEKIAAAQKAAAREQLGVTERKPPTSMTPGPEEF